MHYKSLLAAMMVGALALSSCVKNEESQSVTDLRNARADEIKSQAELNRANADAAIIVAKAQESVASAQAKLIEAQASIAQAEAAKVRAEAELAAVEVEIAKVKLEEEKVKLQAKKAELEATIAKVEAEIAQYKAQKQKALDEIAKAEAEAELNAIKMQKQLIEEQEALMKAMAKYGKEKEKEINKIWKQYSDEVTALNVAQTKLIKTMADLAKLEAGSETSGEILAEQISNLEARIEAQKIFISDLKSKMQFTKPELDAVLKLATAEVATALTDQQQALEASRIIDNTLFDKQSASYVYEQGWYDGDNFIAWLNSIVDEYNDFSYEYEGNKVNVFYLTNKWNEETQRMETGVYYYFESGDPDENYATYNTFVPLYTMDARWSYFEGTPVVYPTSVDGKTPTFSDYFWPRTYTPAKIYFENLAELMSIVASIQAEQYKADVEGYVAEAEFYAEYIQKKREVLASEIEAQTAFVQEAAAVVFPAYQAYRAAFAAYVSALYDETTDYWVAYDNYRHYMDVHNSTANAKAEANALVNVKRATENLAAAQKNFDDISLLLYGSVPNSVTEEGEGGEGEEIVEGLIAKVARLETAAFNAGKAAAEKKVALAEPEKEWTEKKDALEKAVQDANEALVAKEAAIIKAQDEEDTALEAYHKAVIIYTADPNDDTEKAMKEAEEAWKAAQKKVSDLQAELPDLEKAVSDAVAAKDKVYNPYKEAKDAYDTANKIYTEAKQEWTIAKNQLGTREDDPSTSWTAYARYKYYKAQLTLAVSNKEQAEKNLKEAQEKNEGDEELNNLRMVYYNISNLYKELYQKYAEAWDVYSALVYGDEYADPVVEPTYPNFWESYYHVTPGYGVEFPEMYEYTLEEWGPGQNLARYEWYGEMAEAANEYYQNLILRSDYATLVKKYNALASKLGEYAEEEEAYLENIEEMQDLYDNWIEANVAYIDASNKLEEARALKNTLETIKTLVMYSEDGETVVSLEEYNKFIAEQEKELVRLEERMQKLMNELYFGEWLADEGKYAEAKKLELQNEIQALQVEIEMRSALIEKYLDILSHLLSEVE